jgi:hypothetical protein
MRAIICTKDADLENNIEEVKILSLKDPNLSG